MSVRRLLVLGANNPETVRVVQSINDAAPTFELVGFLDNDPAKHGKPSWGFPVLGGSDLVAEPRYRDCVVANAITRDTLTRQQTTAELERFGAELTNLIHPAVDTRHVELGRGIVIHEGALLQPGAVVGNNCALNGHTVVSHECVLGDHVFMAPGSVLAGLVHLGAGVMIGVHATVLPRLQIGEWATVGGGAVVISNVPARAIVAGNPARLLRQQ
ncbi:MAG: acetyltransferase [Acidobacteriota bacterium]|nr:MAG: acetyltransferase [Acidobacteriota bacterium]